MTAAFLPIAVLIGLAIYVAAMFLLPKSMFEDSNKFIKDALERLEDQQNTFAAQEQQLSSTPPANPFDNPFSRAFLLLPGAPSLLPAIEQAQLVDKLPKLVGAGLLLFVGLMFMMAKFGALGLIIAVVLTFVLMTFYVKRRQKYYRKMFIDNFPEALDIIVRSVRAGYPVNAAIGMVSDTMKNWIGDEFQRVVDEAAYGMPLNEAVTRFAYRVDHADAYFFAVVLSVQQESGGNLGEILQNLSAIIRQRKNLRLKIHALSSEGRATAWILGMLPVFMTSAVYYTNPDHLAPLWQTTAGNYVLGGVLMSIFLGVVIMKKIINIDI